MNRSECIARVEEEFIEKRARNEREQLKRMADAAARDPEIDAIREDSAQTALRAMRLMLTEKDIDARRAAAEGIRRHGMENNRRIREKLAALGLPADYLEPHYDCPICRDTGKVGDAPARFCDCFEARVRALMFEDGSMAGTDRENFGTFNENRIPEGEQREQLNKARRLCESFADAFPNTRYTNIVLTGQSGLGKTFLLNSVYERVMSRGYSAVRITAFRMFETMRRMHMDMDARAEDFEALLNAPLLLIDDLGSEPAMRNITVEYLFTLLNERMAAGRSTMIASNLTPLQIVERYGERVKSRMFDRQKTACVQLKGVDLRSL